MTRNAAAYLRDGKVIIQAYDRTTSGVWIGAGPVFIALADDSLKVGQNVLEALNASRDGVPHPTEWAGLLKPFLAAVGVRSWRAFSKDVFYVGIRLNDNFVKLQPSRNGGAKEGFVPLPAKARMVPQEAVELGKNLLAAFAESE